MWLPRPFYRFPLLVDAERLRAEVGALPAAAWVAHPNQLPGNSAVRPSAPPARRLTPAGPHAANAIWLRACPVYPPGAGRIRRGVEPLATDAPGARREVPQHADITVTAGCARAHPGDHAAASALPLR